MWRGHTGLSDLQE